MHKTNKRKIIVIVEILCLLVVCFVAYKTITARIEHQKQIVAQEEAARAEKEAEEKARREKEEELKQWNMILVNHDKEMPDDFSIKTVEVENGYVIDERVCDSLKQMLADCRDAGFSPRIISSFRTRETQQYLYDHTANKADTALPGHSEHECGLAADIIDSSSLGWRDPLIEKQEELPTQKWLMEHCQDYGFILRYPKDKVDVTGIVYEPWHYRYVGKIHAKAIMSSGVCLEEYIENYLK